MKKLLLPVEDLRAWRRVEAGEQERDAYRLFCDGSTSQGGGGYSFGARI